MVDGDALLRGIIGEPGDDLVRLAYADWCEENGQSERAEFVRLQIAKERDPVFHGFLCLPERRCANCRREHGLLSTGRVFDWLGDWTRQMLPGTPAVWHKGGGECLFYHNRVDDSKLSVTFRRGFAEAVRCPLAAWEAHGPEVAAAHPVARVGIADRRAWEGRQRNDAPVTYWGWWVSSADFSRPEIEMPPALMGLLARDPRRKPGPRDYYYGSGGHGGVFFCSAEDCVLFGSAKDCADATSAALLAWARPRQ